MSLRARVIGLLVVLGVILVITSALVESTLQRVEQQNRMISQRLQPASVEARGLLASVINQETGQRGYVITGDEGFLEPYRRGQTDTTRRLGGLRTAFTDDRAVAHAIDEVDTSVERWREVGAQPEIAARRAGDVKTANGLVLEGTGKRAFGDVRRKVEALQSLIDERVDDARTNAATDSRTLRNGLLASGGLRLGLLLAAALLLRRWVLLPIADLRASMRRVAGGDLEVPVQVAGPAEVAAIGTDAESMRRRIVQELDTARAAGEALEQHSPVVASLRAELAAGPTRPDSGLTVSGVLYSAEGVLAGDWWETVTRPDGSTVLVVADVSGHGARAGMVALRFKHRITTLLRTDLDLLTAFTVVAQDLDADAECFVSCLVVQVDPTTSTLRWINAGHPPALLASRRGGELVSRELVPTGPLVNALTSGWEVAETAIRPDELLLAVTDGVVDARGADLSEFGHDGVREVLRGLTLWTPQAAATECAEAVRRFADQWRRDDLTCAALALEPAEPVLDTRST